MSVLKESIDGWTKNRGIEILGISVVFYDHTVFQAIFSVDMCVKSRFDILFFVDEWQEWSEQYCRNR